MQEKLLKRSDSSSEILPTDCLKLTSQLHKNILSVLKLTNLKRFLECSILLKIDCMRKMYYNLLTDALPDFSEVNQDNPNCVVLGDATENFSYQNLNKAFQLLMSLDKPVLFALGGG